MRPRDDTPSRPNKPRFTITTIAFRPRQRVSRRLALSPSFSLSHSLSLSLSCSVRSLFLRDENRPHAAKPSRNRALLIRSLIYSLLATVYGCTYTCCFVTCPSAVETKRIKRIYYGYRYHVRSEDHGASRARRGQLWERQTSVVERTYALRMLD